MKRLPQILFGLMIILLAASCNKDESVWEKYKDWRNANNDFFNSKSYATTPNGQGFEYEHITPDWDKGSFILMKRFKDGPDQTKVPLYTSTVDVMYKGMLYDGTGFDSTYLYTDSITTFRCSSTVLGFAIALTNMAVGDSCEVIIPQYLAYGAQESGKIKPYSTLVFGIKLVGIPGYEKPVIPE